MLKSLLPQLLVSVLMSVSCSSSNDMPDGGEKLLLLGNVITMDATTPSAEAVVVRNGIITFVGSQTDARKMCDAKTTVKDYGTASIYPGFTEGHTHGSLASHALCKQTS